MPTPKSVRLWESLRLWMPIAAFLLPYPIARLLGGFAPGFQMIGQEVTPVEAFGILGTILLPSAAWYYATMRLEKAMAAWSRSWPTVSGTIEASDISEKRAYRSGRYYALDVRYRYSVGGLDLVNEKLAFAPRWLSSPYTVDSLAHRYAAGATVDVHYNPGQPREAVLETDDRLANDRMFPVWICLFVIVFAVVFLLIRRVVT